MMMCLILGCCLQHAAQGQVHFDIICCHSEAGVVGPACFDMEYMHMWASVHVSLHVLITFLFYHHSYSYYHIQFHVFITKHNYQSFLVLMQYK